jgi:hypothetical protein
MFSKIERYSKTKIRVLFDESHSESWTISGDEARKVNPVDVQNCSYERLAEVIVQSDCLVQRLTKPPIDYDKLRNFDILVIAHPADRKVCRTVGGEPVFQESEIETISRWVSDGHCLFIINEYEVDKWGSNINDLCRIFGLAFNNDTVYDQIHFEVQPTWPKIHSFKPHTITQGLKEIIYYVGCSISVVQPGEGIIFSDSDSIPPNQPILAVSQYGQGRVVVIGDSDLFDGGRINKEEHIVLVRNIINWFREVTTVINAKKTVKFLPPSNELEIILDIQHSGGDILTNIVVLDNLPKYLKASGNTSLNIESMSSMESRRFSYLIRDLNLNGSIALGPTMIEYTDKSDAKHSLSIEPIIFDLEGKQFIEKDIKQRRIEIMQKCPLNLGNCALGEDIKTRYQPRRVFLDIPYRRDYSHFESIIRDVLARYKLEAVAAKDRSITKILLCNICNEIQTCNFGIADVSNVNPNTIYELGLMHGIGKKCMILRQKKSKQTVDLQGILCETYENTDDIRNKLSKWIENNIFTEE